MPSNNLCQILIAKSIRSSDIIPPLDPNENGIENNSLIHIHICIKRYLDTFNIYSLFIWYIMYNNNIINISMFIISSIEWSFFLNKFISML